MKLTDEQWVSIHSIMNRFSCDADYSGAEVRSDIEQLLTTPPQEAGKEEILNVAAENHLLKSGYFIDSVIDLLISFAQSYAAPIQAELEAAKREIESLKLSMAELGIITGEDARRFKERHNESVKKLNKK